ncbi:hypothetical protein [Aeromonas veronii]|uniref:Uncharacterized protein n=1 Tax=Aeromonas veronii TaxID=654 RepID=A0A4S5CGM5_AERVE|nr:hypothetical protein [Aeromonas veronii]THJ45024.1 hypothetical protein E8Q35_12615 [Aeromonas veronii]
MAKVFIAMTAIVFVGIVSALPAKAGEIKHEEYSTHQLAALTRLVERTEKSLELILHNATLDKDDRKFLESTLEDLQQTQRLWELDKCSSQSDQGSNAQS